MYLMISLFICLPRFWHLHILVKLVTWFFNDEMSLAARGEGGNTGCQIKQSKVKDASPQHLRKSIP